jgi:sugar phosphate isomerase/epimerase
MNHSRRKFIGQVAGAAGLMFLNRTAAANLLSAASWFEISLAEWSLHKALQSKKITNLDFPGISKKQFGISVVEYVNQFFKDKAEDTKYLNQLLQRCSDNGIKNHLIMIDGEGELANLDEAERKKAVEKHYKWVNAAKHLGCATIRVNAFGKGSAEDVKKAAVEGLGTLGDYAAKENINVVVENHGGYSSDGQWMLSVLQAVNKPNVGMLPDFGNFCIRRDDGSEWGGKCVEQYDKYKGVTELMPFAKGVSAKTMEFDAKGNCVETDYDRMMKIVKDAGFKGYIGIEYEGDKLSEEDGIRHTKTLLEKYRQTA